MKVHRTIFVTFFFLLGASVAPVFAREVGGEADVLRLSKLYERSFQAGEDSAYVKRLEDERILLREAFLGDLQELVKPVVELYSLLPTTYYLVACCMLDGRLGIAESLQSDSEVLHAGNRLTCAFP